MEAEDEGDLDFADDGHVEKKKQTRGQSSCGDRPLTEKGAAMTQAAVGFRHDKSADEPAAAAVGAISLGALRGLALVNGDSSDGDSKRQEELPALRFPYHDFANSGGELTTVSTLSCWNVHWIGFYIY